MLKSLWDPEIVVDHPKMAILVPHVKGARRLVGTAVLQSPSRATAATKDRHAVSKDDTLRSQTQCRIGRERFDQFSRGPWRLSSARLLKTMSRADRCTLVVRPANLNCTANTAIHTTFELYISVVLRRLGATNHYSWLCCDKQR